MAISDKPRLVMLKTAEIKVPEVRITSVWDPEDYAMFQASIKAMGIVDKPVVVQAEGIPYLVDGKHRLQEAQLNNETQIQCVLVPGSLADVYLKNLTLNKLRGRTKASEMVLVVKHLQEQFHMGIEDIAGKTGLKKDYIEKMLRIGQVHREVWEALDAERIPR